MKVFSSVVIFGIVIICCDFVCSKSVTAIAKKKAKTKIGHVKVPVLLDQALADQLQQTNDDFYVKFAAGASDEELAENYDHIDVMIMMPNITTLTDRIHIIATLRVLITSLPEGSTIQGVMVESYSYRFGGFRVANAICRNFARDVAGNIIYIARVSMIWRRFGRKNWKIHRENTSIECTNNCSEMDLAN